MSWFRTIIFLSFALTISSQPNHHKASAVIVGTVYCDTCFQQNFHKNSHFISGASVAVECKDRSSRGGFRQVVKTDGRGEFKVHLPVPISKHVNRIKGCSVRLISSNKPYCSVAASASSSNWNLKSRKQGTHVFSAGFFTFRPFQQPQVCDQKPIIKNPNIYEKSSPISNPNDPTFLPPIQDPPSDPPSLGGYLPPLPRLPSLPPLPRLPPLPGLPFLPPVPKKIAADKTQKLANSKISQPNTIPFPTNPLNPPSIFPTNPFLPPPLGFPPIFPSRPFFNLPPVPGFSASAPPSFSVPIPRFPFQPTPGAPPAEVSSPRKPSSP